MNLANKKIEHEGSPPLFDTGIVVRCLDREAIFSLGDEWNQLAGNSLEDNAYYAPAYMLPALEYADKNCEINALAAYKNDVLIGFLPFVVNKWRWLGAIRVNMAWTNPYIASTVPLIDKDQSEEAMNALITAMGEQGAEGRFWLLNHFNVEGPVAKLMNAVMAAQGLSSALFDGYQRPAMTLGETFEDHMQTQVSRSRRRGLARNRKRLEELGDVAFRSYTSGADLDEAVEAFLEIEASGWKGEKGTALACNESLTEFARAALGGKNGKQSARADVLYLNNEPIAASLSACSGRTVFTLKCAYNEDYKAYAPGLLMEQDIVASFLNEEWADCLDSAITVKDHVLQGLWSDHIEVGDMLMCADPRKTPEKFAHYHQVEAMRRRLRKMLKDVVHKARDARGA